MGDVEIGIIGGTGLGDLLLKEAGGVPIDVDTPFGKPSCPPIVAAWEGRRVAFIARHGAGHTFNPTNVPYRANIYALKQLGATAVIASGATGSLRENIHPGELVVCDQVIDRTSRRASTFFDEGLVVHVELADPFCPTLRRDLVAAAAQLDLTAHDGGTYVCMEGPQFSTRAESHLHRAWGGDVIGMTAMPEAKLAREAELCYALVALPTDYDCWRPHPGDPPHDALLREILGNLKLASQRALTLIRQFLRVYNPSSRTCGCGSALKLAIWSDLNGLAPAVRQRLGSLVERYIS